MPDLQCSVVTPEQTVRDGPAEFVALSLWDGEIGIAPGHTPLVGRLGYGEMRITVGGHCERYYVEGGFVEVVGDVVSVLTARAIPAGKLDEAVAQEQLAAARERPARTPASVEARDRAVAQSRAQLLVARRAARE
jgi:F-type H+-transporting ATPase subunit epsilon